MNRLTGLRKFVTVLLLAVVLLVGTAFSHVTQGALAEESREVNEISNFKGDSSNVNRSYHNLQDATQEYRNEYREGERPGQQESLTDRMGNRNNGPKQAAKNVGKNTRNAFGRAADSVKETLDPG